MNENNPGKSKEKLNRGILSSNQFVTIEELFLLLHDFFNFILLHTMAITKEQKFYQALQDVFFGAKIEGQGGFVNLMKIKSNYYRDIEKLIK